MLPDSNIRKQSFRCHRRQIAQRIPLKTYYYHGLAVSKREVWGSNFVPAPPFSVNIRNAIGNIARVTEFSEPQIIETSTAQNSE
jgi:hypothetical protein